MQMLPLPLLMLFVTLRHKQTCEKSAHPCDCHRSMACMQPFDSGVIILLNFYISKQMSHNIEREKYIVRPGKTALKGYSVIVQYQTGKYKFFHKFALLIGKRCYNINRVSVRTIRPGHAQHADHSASIY